MARNEELVDRRALGANGALAMPQESAPSARAADLRARPLLPYTICFCRRGDRILMLYRSKPPNARHWNGLGGKLLPGETPEACVRREILEEAGIDLCADATARFAGIVTWATGHDRAGPRMGMYTFVAELPPRWPIWPDGRWTPEGLLAWRLEPWVGDRGNTEVVDNIARVLPALLRTTEPREYACRYRGSTLVEVVSHSLRSDIRIDVPDGVARGVIPPPDLR